LVNQTADITMTKVDRDGLMKIEFSEQNDRLETRIMS
jgi:hypothetical protein